MHEFLKVLLDLDVCTASKMEPLTSNMAVYIYMYVNLLLGRM